MKFLNPLSIFIGIIACMQVHSQEEFSKDPTITLFTGIINYQGDLNPNSFTFNHSNFAAGLVIRKPLNRLLTLRAGIHMGKIEAADRYNRDYLQPRNLSFYNTIQELSAGLEITVLDISTKKFIPYIYGGVAVFHMNPWTYDNNHKKTFLQPLSTEGQGLSQYPDRKPYGLVQVSLPFGGGIKYALTNEINIGIEFSQRKSFTDYIDDVSTYFVDKDALLQAKGPKAVELAYRGDEVPGGQQTYPIHGEQRGTPAEMDWYYLFGTTLEIKINALAGLFKGNNNSMHGAYSQRCPRHIY